MAFPARGLPNWLHSSIVYIGAISHRPVGRSMANGKQIRLLIADDNAMYRHALREILEAHPSLQVVGEATDGEDAILRAEELQPAIVLMDINMPILNGIAATRRIKAEHESMTVIGLSVHTDRDYVEAMLDAGAMALLSKEKATEDLYAVIERAIGATE
jgi:DNA-binding NarL/FixJ family response regulator